MSTDMKQKVDTTSVEFIEGVKAGLNSAEDSKNLQAGLELGQELKDESGIKEPVSEVLFKEPSPPLFISDSPEGNQGNAQDEKDESEE